MKRFAERYTFRFAVSAARLWREISDTDAVNRDAGLPPVTYTYERGAGGLGATVARARFGFVTLRWEEPPFLWEAPHRVAVERRFRGGPFLRFASDVRIEPDGDGSRVVHAVELDARGPLGALLAPLVLARGRAGAQRAYRLAERRAERERDLPATAVVIPDVPPARLERVARFVDASEALRPHTEDEPEIAARLASLVEHGDDQTVARMRPYVLADAWELPRAHVLGSMLAATRAGLLDLRWTLICPSCRGQKNSVASLSALGPDVHCDTCGVSYGPGFDRNVEVTFDARPSGRTATPAAYCLAGPQTARQSLAQTRLGARGSAVLHIGLAPGAYLIEVLPDRRTRIVVEEDAGDERLHARIGNAGVHVALPIARAGSVEVALENETGSDIVVRVTEAGLSDQIATAADVTALQAFRDLFSSEILAEGIELAIRSMTILFSDLVGSTAMYAENGDARAFRLVREHFDALRDVVATHRGAVVKTIGDAVMAAFVDPRDAVEAALAFRDAALPLRLRVGMHRGPCIAMRANDMLDYFGGTVNVASRVGHAAGADEVLMTAAVADDPRVADIIPRDAARGSVVLRGVPDPVPVVRVAVGARLEVTA